MKKFITLKSIALPINRKDIDTDLIIPAQYLTSISKEGFGVGLFARIKSTDATFPYNNPKFAGAKILIAGENFGCGSSREHAVWALLDAGFDCVIAKSYSDIFTSNSNKNGLLLVQLKNEEVDVLCEKAEAGVEIEINLEAQSVISENLNFIFEINPFAKECLLKGQDQLDFLLDRIELIKKFKNEQVVYATLTS